MKWFMGVINCGNKVRKPRIEELFKKNYSVCPPQNGLEIIGENYSYAEIYDNNYKFQYGNNVNDDIVILGDIEIYNKEQLLKKYLGINEVDSDCGFLVQLYKLIGIDFVTELSGEFSFILYDKKSLDIYLIRDHLGIKPLYWIKEDERLYYATDIFLLIDFFNISNLNEDYFKEFYLSNGHIDSDQTPFTNVNRVKTGSYVYISLGNNMETNYKYWDLANSQYNIRYKTNEEYVDTFLELLKSAVDKRLLHNGNDGVMMSGGIDSTSLFAVGKSVTQASITPVCGIFEELKSCDERYYINQVLERYNQNPIYVPCDELGMLKGYPDDYFFTYEPHVNSLVLRFSDGILKSASRNGIESIIDGYAGDHLLTGSLIHVIDKIKTGKWGQASEVLRANSNRLNKSIFECISEYIIWPMLNPKKLPDFDKNICNLLAGKINKLKYFNQKELYIQLNCTKARQYLDREIGPRNNISVKHPFLDKELIEFVFNIPGEFRLNKKYNKFILREAIKQFLPNEVVDRVSKTQHVSLSIKGLADVWPHIYSCSKTCLLRELNIIDISVNEWQEQLHKYRSGQVVREDFLVLLTMELWLYEYFKKISIDRSYQAI